MKQITYLLLVSAIIIASCQNKEVEIPNNILPKDTMAVILTKMQLIEASVSTRIIKTNEQKKGLAFYAQVFQEHNTTKENYDESYRFYSTHPLLLEEIYELVLIKLSTMQAAVDKEFDYEDDE